MARRTPWQESLRVAPAEVRSAVDRGLDMATTVKDTAGEVMRRRRDPAQIAARRRRAARRRLMAWSLAGIVVAGGGVTSIEDLAAGDHSPGSVGGLVILFGLAAFFAFGAVRAGLDLRRRNREVRALPPPGQFRAAVAGAIRPLIARLDGYCDVLRYSVAGIGAVPDESIRELRDDTLAAADAAEARLRAMAGEYSAMVRSGGASPDLVAMRGTLERDIASGVDDYGKLVSAATAAADASAQMLTAGRPNDLADLTDRLSALAAGMREITGDPAV